MQLTAALVSVIVIDLVLTGDNVILTAPAVCNLPPELQKKAVVWGAASTIVVRALMTLVVMWLLRILGLMLVGGLTLVWIVQKFLTDDGRGSDEHGMGSTTLTDTMETIIIVDAAMSIGNMLTITGVSHGSLPLVVLSLLISVPIAVWGNGMVLRLIERLLIIIYGGVTVLTYTAAYMIVAESVLKALFTVQSSFKWTMYVMMFLIVPDGGWLVQHCHQQSA